MKAVKKKISIFLMTLMLASTFSANVTKADVIESKNTIAYEEIMPYAAVCPRCGGRITSSTVWGSWISSGTVTCTHGHAWGTDLKQYRTGIKTTKCLNCNAGNTANVKETRTICHGYDN